MWKIIRSLGCDNDFYLGGAQLTMNVGPSISVRYREVQTLLLHVDTEHQDLGSEGLPVTRWKCHVHVRARLCRC